MYKGKNKREMSQLKQFLSNMRATNTQRLIVSTRTSNMHTQMLNNKNFDKHALVALGTDRSFSSLFGVFVHQVNRGAGQGGLRYWKYDTVDDVLSDGLRLSKGMSQKSALAGLWWGGGKGIVAYPDDEPKSDIARQELFEDYGSFVSSLNGIYYTAEDVGTVTKDMNDVFSTTRYVTCIDEAMGGSGNPSFYTAKGVVSCLDSLVDLPGKTLSCQGLGNVSQPMIDMLIQKGVDKIHVCEMDTAKIDAVKNKHGNKINVVGLDDIYDVPADVFVPNALGGILNEHTIPRLQAKIVCGAANNQLLDPESDTKLLQEHKIEYIPDYVVNRMGIVNCSNENYGKLDPDPEIEKHYGTDYEHSLPNTIHKIKALAKERHISLSEAADRVAACAIEEKHPIFGDRFNQIASSL